MNRSDFEFIENRLINKYTTVACFCLNCDKYVVMKYNNEYYSCPYCQETFDCTGRMKPNDIDLINYNREKLGQ